MAETLTNEVLQFFYYFVYNFISDDLVIRKAEGFDMPTAEHYIWYLFGTFIVVPIIIAFCFGVFHKQIAKFLIFMLKVSVFLLVYTFVVSALIGGYIKRNKKMPSIRATKKMSHKFFKDTIFEDFMIF